MGILARHPESNLKSNLLQVTEKQLKCLVDAGLDPVTTDRIATEFLRLCRIHPDWRRVKAMRKAGEKYGVEFKFTDATEAGQ